MLHTLIKPGGASLLLVHLPSQFLILSSSCILAGRLGGTSLAFGQQTVEEVSEHCLLPITTLG